LNIARRLSGAPHETHDRRRYEEAERERERQRREEEEWRRNNRWSTNSSV